MVHLVEVAVGVRLLVGVWLRVCVVVLVGDGVRVGTTVAVPVALAGKYGRAMILFVKKQFQQNILKKNTAALKYGEWAGVLP